MRGAIITQVLDEADPVLGFAAGWVNALAARVERLEAICLSRGQGTLADNVHVTVLPAGRFARTRRVRGRLRQLKRDTGLDFVFAHTVPSYAVAATLPTKFAPTFLWYAHSQVTRMLRVAGRRCDRVFSCSEESYPLAGHDSLAAVGHGIDTERFRPGEAHTASAVLHLCMMGRISPVKRHADLIRALGLLAESHPQLRVQCRIVGPVLGRGDREYLNELHALIGQLCVASVVRVAPPVPYAQVVPFYQATDLVVNTTGRRAIDKAVLEAMACGCLVVVTGTGFVPLLGRHEELLVAAEASPKAVAGAIARLGALPVEQRVKLGRELRQIVVEEHSVARMMERIVEEIGAVCHARGEP